MGNRVSSIGIDGLGVRVPYAIPRPTKESTEKLNQLIRANNASYQVFFNHRKFHNHLPHSLSSIYFLGATPEQLTAMYEEEAEKLDPWLEDSPENITDQNWVDHLGDKAYERGYFDYFSDKISDASWDYSTWDWRKVSKDFLLDHNGENMFDGLVGGLLHPLIHFGYAQELDSGFVAAEALTLTACSYQDLSTFVKPDDKVPKTDDVVSILMEIRNDPSFDEFDHPSKTSTTKAMERFPEQLNHYTNRLQIDSTTPEKLIKASAALFAASHKDNDPQYDFFLLHCLTSSHETLELLLAPAVTTSFIPKNVQEKLVRELWFTVVTVYVAQCRPTIKPSRVNDYHIDSKEAAWKEAVDLTLNGKERFDLHLAKAVRALLFTEQYFAEDTDFYAKAVLQYARNFSENGYANRNGHYLDIKN
jgi:hypothetical protein